MHFLALFHTAIPIQPPPLQGTSFHRKEGVSTRAPSFGRGCRAQRGGVGFLFCGARVLSSNGALETIPPLFHTARTLSGSLRSPPSPHGEGFIRRYSFSTHACIRFDDARKPAFSYRSLPHWGRGTALAVDRVLSLIVDLRCISSLSFIPLSPSNLRPFGAPPSIGRRQCPREPLPLEGAAKRSEAGLASFFGGEAASSLPSPLRKALPGNRYSRFFIHPTQKRPSLTSGRFYVYYLLRETLIKSQNSI